MHDHDDELMEEKKLDLIINNENNSNKTREISDPCFKITFG